MSRQQVLSTRIYRGYTIEHVEADEWRSPRPFHPAGYYKRRFWWVVEFEDDTETLREAKALIDHRHDDGSS